MFVHFLLFLLLLLVLCFPGGEVWGANMEKTGGGCGGWGGGQQPFSGSENNQTTPSIWGLNEVSKTSTQKVDQSKLVWKENTPKSTYRALRSYASTVFSSRKQVCVSQVVEDNIMPYLVMCLHFDSKCWAENSYQGNWLNSLYWKDLVSCSAHVCLLVRNSLVNEVELFWLIIYPVKTNEIAWSAIII